MKIVEVAFMLLVFNICMGIVAHSEIFTPSPLYYESSYINKFANVTSTSNISTSSETQQYTVTMGFTQLIIDCLTFNWLYQYIPEVLWPHFSLLITGLNAVMGFFLVVAFIELFVKQLKVLGD
jgi:hypothetical protein